MVETGGGAVWTDGAALCVYLGLRDHVVCIGDRWVDCFILLFVRDLTDTVEEHDSANYGRFRWLAHDDNQHIFRDKDSHELCRGLLLLWRELLISPPKNAIFIPKS